MDYVYAEVEYDLTIKQYYVTLDKDGSYNDKGYYSVMRERISAHSIQQVIQILKDYNIDEFELYDCGYNSNETVRTCYGCYGNTEYTQTMWDFIKQCRRIETECW